MHHMPESSSPLVSLAKALLGAEKSHATASSYSDKFSHRQNNIKDGLGGGFGVLILFVFLLWTV